MDWIHWYSHSGLYSWYAVLLVLSNKKGIKTLLLPFIFCYHGRYLLWSRSFYGEHSHLAIMGVLALVGNSSLGEGFFEVFSTTLMAFILLHLVLYRIVLVLWQPFPLAPFISSVAFLAIFHHLYFTGVTSTIVATGASFSALECSTTCTIIGYEAFENYTRLHSAPWCIVWNGLYTASLRYPSGILLVRGLRLLDQYACILVLHSRS